MQEPPLDLKICGKSLEPVPLAFDDSHVAGQLVYMLPFSAALRPCETLLSCLWELVLLAHSVVVVGADAAAAARGALAVLSIISPLTFAGEVRPFLDVDNPAVLASLNVTRPCIVGVVGTAAVSRLPVPEGGWHVVWLVEPKGLSSSYSPALASEPPPASGFDESSDALILRSQVMRLVVEFFAPLDSYAAQLLAAAVKATTAFRAAPPPFFDSTAALAWLEETHLPRTNPQAAKRLLLYRRFFSSPTFGLWRLSKQVEAAPDLIAAQLAAIKALPTTVQKLGELELVDVIIRASEAARLAGDGTVRTALEAEVERMRAALPIDLQQSMPGAIMSGFTPHVTTT